MSDKFTVPRHLDDPELIGLWTVDDFLGMVVPFAMVDLSFTFAAAGYNLIRLHRLLGEAA